MDKCETSLIKNLAHMPQLSPTEEVFGKIKARVRQLRLQSIIARQPGTREDTIHETARQLDRKGIAGTISRSLALWSMPAFEDCLRGTNADF